MAQINIDKYEAILRNSTPRVNNTEKIDLEINRASNTMHVSIKNVEKEDQGKYYLKAISQSARIEKYVELVFLMRG